MQKIVLHTQQKTRVMGRTSKGLDIVFSTHLRAREEGKVLNSQSLQTSSLAERRSFKPREDTAAARLMDREAET